MQTPNDIQQIGEDIVAILRELSQAGPMLRGSFSVVERKCAKATCWCAKPGAAGHPSARITWKENGVSRTRTVAAKDLDRIRRMAEAYKNYRRMRRSLREKEFHLEQILDTYEQTAQIRINAE